MSDDNNLQPDPMHTPPESGGNARDADEDVAGLLDSIEHAAQMDARNNYRVLDNNIKQSQLVVANVAALKSINQDDESLLRAAGELAENPT